MRRLASLLLETPPNIVRRRFSDLASLGKFGLRALKLGDNGITRMVKIMTQSVRDFLDAGIKVTDQEVDRAIESVAQQNKMSATELRSRVESTGMSWTKYRDELRKQVQVIRLREREVDSKVQVYDGEIDNFVAARSGK